MINQYAFFWSALASYMMSSKLSGIILIGVVGDWEDGISVTLRLAKRDLVVVLGDENGQKFWLAVMTLEVWVADLGLWRRFWEMADREATVDQKSLCSIYAGDFYGEM